MYSAEFKKWVVQEMLASTNHSISSIYENYRTLEDRGSLDVSYKKWMAFSPTEKRAEKRKPKRIWK